MDASDLSRVVGEAVSEVSIAAILACGQKYGFDGSAAVVELGLDQLTSKLSLEETAAGASLPRPPAPSLVPRQSLAPPVAPPYPSAPFIAPYPSSWSARIEKIKQMRAMQRELVEKDVENRQSYFTVRRDERKSNKDYNISDSRTPTATASTAQRRDDGTRGLLTELTRSILGTAAPRLRASLHTPLYHNTPIRKHHRSGPTRSSSGLQPWLPTGPSVPQGSCAHLDGAAVRQRSPHRKTNRAGVKQLNLRRRIQADERRHATRGGGVSPACLRSVSPRPRPSPVAETPGDVGDEGEDEVEEGVEREGEGGEDGESCLLPSRLRLFGQPAASPSLDSSETFSTYPTPSHATPSYPTPSTSPRPSASGRRQLVLTCTVIGGSAPGKDGVWERHGVVALQASCTRIDFLRAICRQLHLRMHVGTSQLSRSSLRKTGHGSEPVIHDVVLVSEHGYSQKQATQSLKQQTLTDPPRLSGVSHIIVHTHDGHKEPKDIST